MSYERYAQRRCENNHNDSILAKIQIRFALLKLSVISPLLAPIIATATDNFPEPALVGFAASTWDSTFPKNHDQLEAGEHPTSPLTFHAYRRCIAT